MPDYGAHVLVCNNSEGAEDKRHCGDKNGAAVRQKFNELLVKHGLLEKVTVSNVGCTSQQPKFHLSVLCKFGSSNGLIWLEYTCQ